MMRWLGWLIGCGLWIGLGLAWAADSPGLSSEEKPKLTLQIGIPTSGKPYAYLDQNKQPAGLLVKRLQAICQQLPADCTLVGGSTEQLINDLQSVKLNAVLILDDFLAPEVDKLRLTQPLCKASPAFIQHEDMPLMQQPADFRGMTIAVQEGSIYHIYLLDEYSSVARIKAYPFMSNAVFDLVMGRVDALFADEALLRTQILDTALNGYVAFSQSAITIPDRPKTLMALALREQDTDLFKTVDSAIAALQATPFCVQLLPSTAPPKP